jgi:hypothetical protein
MEYEDIWQKVKRMSQWERKLLAFEMTTRGFDVGYIHPHYYFDAKSVHSILFYPQHNQHEVNDEKNEYYCALKNIIEHDEIIHLRVRRYSWLPRFVNDIHEAKIVKSYICSRLNDRFENAHYRILPGIALSGDRLRLLSIRLADGKEITYKMTECSHKNGYELLTFSRTDY